MGDSAENFLTPIRVNKNVAEKRNQFVNGDATSIDEKTEASPLFTVLGRMKLGSLRDKISIQAASKRLIETLRRGKVYLVSMDMPGNCTYGRRIFGALKCDWFAQDFGQPWNKYTTSTYMMCQGFVYSKDQVDPMQWRGL
ncbi:hypothetical protein DAPPUDRAFT_277623, partial [Daphnia pulex]